MVMRAAGIAAVVAAGSGDIALTCLAEQDAYGQVPQGGHDLRAVAGADLGGVFSVGDVADVVQGLDLPMPADPSGQLSWGWPGQRPGLVTA